MPALEFFRWAVKFLESSQVIGVLMGSQQTIFLASPALDVTYLSLGQKNSKMYTMSPICEKTGWQVRCGHNPEHLVKAEFQWAWKETSKQKKHPNTPCPMSRSTRLEWGSSASCLSSCYPGLTYWACSSARQSILFLTLCAFSQPSVMTLSLKIHFMCATVQDLLYRSQWSWQRQNKRQMVLLLHRLRSLCSTCKRCLNSYKTVTVPAYMLMSYLTARHFYLLTGKTEFKCVCVYFQFYGVSFKESSCSTRVQRAMEKKCMRH